MSSKSVVLPFQTNQDDACGHDAPAITPISGTVGHTVIRDANRECTISAAACTAMSYGTTASSHWTSDTDAIDVALAHDRVSIQVAYNASC